MTEYQVFKAGPRKGEPKTFKDRVIRYLTEGRGMTRIHLPRTSRLAFHDGLGGVTKYYFVGRAGGVRVGRTYTTSISVSETVRSDTILWENIYKN